MIMARFSRVLQFVMSYKLTKIWSIVSKMHCVHVVTTHHLLSQFQTCG